MNAIAETEEFFDLTYSNEPASYYYLVLELGANEAKAMWYHSTKNLITGFAIYPFNGSLKTLFSSYKFLGSEFKEVLISFRTNNYLLTPRTFDLAEHAQVFQLTNEQQEGTRLKSFSLVNSKTDITYTVPEELDREIHGLIKHHRLFPHIGPSIENELNRLKQREGKSFLCAHVSEDYVDIRCYKDGKLCLSNSFFQSGKEDIAYYILYVSEILELDIEHIPLIISGDVKIGDEIWTLLSSYWKHVEQNKPLSTVDYSSEITNFSHFKFDYLTHALLCAS